MIPPDQIEQIQNTILAYVRRKLTVIKTDFAEFEEEYVDDLVYSVEDALQSLSDKVTLAVEHEVEKHADTGEGRSTLGSRVREEP